jgi:YHS domain-containing protein
VVIESGKTKRKATKSKDEIMSGRILKEVLISGFVFAAMLVWVSGCGKSGSTAPKPQKGQQPAASAVQAGEQTTCPVMEGQPINKAVFTEYKGKKVYFCCESCKPEFEKNPEKYLGKLPQFAKQSP